jgi:uridine phosphorylase
VLALAAKLHSDVPFPQSDSGRKIVTQLMSAQGPHDVYEIDWEGVPIAVYHPAFGSALAGAFLEEIIAMGCRSFVAVGGAGGLVPELTVGHGVVPTAAIRDEAPRITTCRQALRLSPALLSSPRSRRYFKGIMSRS